MCQLKSCIIPRQGEYRTTLMLKFIESKMNLDTLRWTQQVSKGEKNPIMTDRNESGITEMDIEVINDVDISTFTRCKFPHRISFLVDFEFN